MTTEAEFQAVLEDLLPTAVKALKDIAIGPKTSATNRLKVIEMLLRVARAPSRPRASQAYVAAAREARTALPEALSFLKEIIKTHKSERIRSRATKLAAQIGH